MQSAICNDKKLLWYGGRYSRFFVYYTLPYFYLDKLRCCCWGLGILICHCLDHDFDVSLFGSRYFDISLFGSRYFDTSLFGSRYFNMAQLVSRYFHMSLLWYWCFEMMPFWSWYFDMPLLRSRYFDTSLLEYRYVLICRCWDLDILITAATI